MATGPTQKYTGNTIREGATTVPVPRRSRELPSPDLCSPSPGGCALAELSPLGSRERCRGERVRIFDPLAELVVGHRPVQRHGVPMAFVEVVPGLDSRIGLAQRER